MHKYALQVIRPHLELTKRASGLVLRKVGTICQETSDESIAYLFSKITWRKTWGYKPQRWTLGRSAISVIHFLILFCTYSVRVSLLDIYKWNEMNIRSLACFIRCILNHTATGRAMIELIVVSWLFWAWFSIVTQCHPILHNDIESTLSISIDVHHLDWHVWSLACTIWIGTYEFLHAPLGLVSMNSCMHHLDWYVWILACTTWIGT